MVRWDRDKAVIMVGSEEGEAKEEVEVGKGIMEGRMKTYKVDIVRRKTGIKKEKLRIKEG